MLNLLNKTLKNTLVVSAALGTLLHAQMSKEEIAKATQNPLTVMYTIPIQSNSYYYNTPNTDGMKNITNFQPVVPVDISDDWVMVTRTIIPVVYDDVKTPNRVEGDTFGLGDTTFTAFFTQKNAKKGSWLWGAGPVVYLPTATADKFGTKKWGVGPAAVALDMNGKWVYGALLMHVWSFAGSDNGKNVNLTTFQPFVNYNLSDGWYVASVPIITANWEATNGNEWTVPLGGGVGKALKFGKLPGTMQLHAYYNVEKLDNYGEDWQLRFQVNLLFPR